MGVSVWTDTFNREPTSMTSFTECSRCGGAGRFSFETCRECNGLGMVEDDPEDNDDEFEDEPLDCDRSR